MAYIVYDTEASSFLDGASYLAPSTTNTRKNHPLFGGQPNHHQIDAKKNLLDAFNENQDNSNILPAPSPKELVRVYLRVKPKTAEEIEISQEANSEDENNDDDEANDRSMVKIESEYQIALNAPKESNTYKNSMNGAGNLVHR